MPTQPISSSFGGLQITGLASGLDTNAIIQALIAVDQQPINNLTNQQSGLTSLNNQLTTLQTSLQGLALDAQALGDPTLFAPTQTVTSNNPSILSATGTSSGAGAVVGGYQVAISQMASSAQRTFTFASPSSADSITIDGQALTVPAGASIQSFVNQINSNSNLDVWATNTNANTVVLSDRATGNNATYIQVTDPGGTLVEQTALAKAGQNAAYTINGTAGSSSSNTVTNAIPGVTLTLNGVTTGTNPVSVNVTAPAPSASSIQSAVNTFVTAYNSVIQQIQAQTTTKPSTTNESQPSLFGDPELTGLLSNMRQAMYTPGAGLPNGMAALSDIGITTGSASGGAPSAQTSLQGQLTVNATTLAAAIQNNPNGVQQVLQAFSHNFSSIVNNEAQPGGGLDARIQGDNTQISLLGNKISSLTQMLAVRQQALKAQFAKLEATLSQSQAQGSWLASQITALPTAMPL
jgi:flagellar hook-associated protein 2